MSRAPKKKDGSYAAAKLSKEDVLSMKKSGDLETLEGRMELAHKHRVTYATIYSIWKRRSWKWLEPGDGIFDEE